MKTTLKLWIFLALSCFAYPALQAQDIHSTNYQFAPLYLNPANTGSFLGSYRVAGSARNQSQWITNPYERQLVSLDAPLAYGFKKHHWIGAGISFYKDQAGDIGRTNTAILFSGAYHWAFDTKYENVLTIGAQYSSVAMKANNAEAARFDDTIFTGAESGDFPLINNLQSSYSGVNVGLLFTKKISKDQTWIIGAAAYHILDEAFQFIPKANSNPNPNPNQGGYLNDLPLRLNFHTAYRAALSKRFTIEPIAYFSIQETATNINLQVHGEYFFNKENTTSLRFGLGYRVQDAMQLMLGGRYKKWILGAAYDLTVSSQAAYNQSFGGVEIGLYRIFTIFKKPKVEPSILCPRF